MNRHTVARSGKATVPISKEVLKAEIAAWSQKMKVQPKEVHVRPMTRKWGSCSTAGRVSFSLDLLSEPYKLRKEIIVHELLHLKVPNHGKLFKALLKAYLAMNIAP
jgi:predicted metal-dependent hydrolase